MVMETLYALYEDSNGDYIIEPFNETSTLELVIKDTNITYLEEVKARFELCDEFSNKFKELLDKYSLQMWSTSEFDGNADYCGKAYYASDKKGNLVVDLNGLFDELITCKQNPHNH